MDKFLGGIDLAKSSLNNAVIQPLAAAPSSPNLGQFYYDTTQNHLYTYNGTSWEQASGASGSGSVTTVSVASANGFAGTVATATTTPVVTITSTVTSGSMVKVVSGALTAAVDLADFIAPSHIGAANGVASLDATGKVPIAQIPASVVGALEYQGVWNASTNSPALASGTGTKGYYYKVSVAGSTTLDGNSVWNVGDWAVFDGTTWDKIDNNEAVTSVAGRTGAIVLTTADVAGALAASNNLSDVASPATARTNLGTVGRYSATIGDGSSTTITITQATHGLAANGQILIQLFDATTGAQVYAGAAVNNGTGAVSFTFASAPSANAYRVVLFG